MKAPPVSGREDRRAAERYRSYPKAERESAELYRRLADASTGDRRAALVELAGMEERHAQHGATRLVELGERVPAAALGMAREERSHARALSRIVADRQSRARGARGAAGRRASVDRRWARRRRHVRHRAAHWH